MASRPSHGRSSFPKRLRPVSFRGRIAGLFLGAFGLFAASSSSAATEQLAAARIEIEQRVLAARAVLKSGVESYFGDAEEVDALSPDKLVQWSNWNNWGNWSNWPNWSNWSNWFNR